MSVNRILENFGAQKKEIEPRISRISTDENRER